MDVALKTGVSDPNSLFPLPDRMCDPGGILSAAFGIRKRDIRNTVAVEVRNGNRVWAGVAPDSTAFSWNLDELHRPIRRPVENRQIGLQVITEIHGRGNQVGYTIAVHIGGDEVDIVSAAVQPIGECEVAGAVAGKDLQELYRY